MDDVRFKLTVQKYQEFYHQPMWIDEVGISSAGSQVERIYASSQSFEALSSELHQRIASNAFEEMAHIKDGLEAVSREVEFLDKIHTWPWQRETVGGLSTALVLPIILWLVTRFLDKLL